jgi:hypothetical protein
VYFGASRLVSLPVVLPPRHTLGAGFRQVDVDMPLVKLLGLDQRRLMLKRL